MTILILEDELGRRDAFAHKLGEHAVTYTDNALLAVKMLHLQQYDAVFLDHDLGDVLDGRFVARCYHGSQNLRTPTLVHSINPSGSEEMVRILKDQKVPVTKCPFCSTVFWSVVKRFLDGLET